MQSARIHHLKSFAERTIKGWIREKEPEPPMRQWDERNNAEQIGKI